MFGEDMYQNQILPFFFSKDNLANKSFKYSRLSDDGINFFVISSLSSDNISDLDKYLELGIDQIKEKLSHSDTDILDRMKSAIFESGDYLANELVESGQPVDDVDFSVCILAFKDGILYIWNDGDLNTRIYRNDQSILVNQNAEPQFFGSTEIELGDILAVSYNKFISEHDANYEEYVLEKTEPSYPALYIDYQLDKEEQTAESKQYSSNFEPEDITEVDVEEQNILVLADELEVEPELERYEDDEVQDLEESTPMASRFAAIREKTSGATSNFREKLKDLKIGDYLARVTPFLKKVGSTLHDIALKITSGILDFFYGTILRRNTHQLKRFQSSYKKRNLQYLLIICILILGVYFAFFRGGSSGEKKPTKTTDTTGTQQDFKKDIDAEFAKLTQFYNTQQLPSFNDSYTKVENLISKAKSSGFADTAYLDSKLKEAQTFQDTLYKVTPVTKVDEIYFSKNISNSKIVDFAVLGADIYAIDRGNNQILKSAANQQFEVFASDARLKNMTQITCTDEVCYIMDEQLGLVEMNTATKKFEVFSGLTEGSKGVKEMIYIYERLYTYIPQEGKVLRYNSVSGGGFQQPTQWNSDAGFDINSSDFGIDGNIFELSKSGIMRKFFGGALDGAFTGLQTANPVLGKTLQLSLTPVAREPEAGVKNRVYIADSDNNRIAVYDKDVSEDGKYKFLGNYKFRGTGDIKFDNFEETYLSSDEKFLYILENNSVYKIAVTEI